MLPLDESENQCYHFELIGDGLELAAGKRTLLTTKTNTTQIRRIHQIRLHRMTTSVMEERLFAQWLIFRFEQYTLRPSLGKTAQECCISVIFLYIYE